MRRHGCGASFHLVQEAWFNVNAYQIITPEILTLPPVAGLRMTRFLGYSLFVLPQDILAIIVGNALERSACDDTAGSIPTNGMVKTIPYKFDLHFFVIPSTARNPPLNETQ